GLTVSGGDVKIEWHPGASNPDCPDVKFIQVVRTTDAAGHRVGDANAKAAGRQTADGWAVDKLDGMLGGGVFYPVKNDGTVDTQLGGTGSTGASPSPAGLGDHAVATDKYWPIHYELLSCAVCRAGPNLGLILDCIYWT